MAKKSKRWTSLPSKVKTINNEKIPLPLESDVQREIIQWSNIYKYKNNPLSMYIHHSPNGGSRNIIEAVKFKLMGVRAGYPDLIIDIAKGGYHGMRVELKRYEEEKTSPNQKIALRLLLEEGYYVVVANSFDEATVEIDNYVRGLKTRREITDQ